MSRYQLATVATMTLLTIPSELSVVIASDTCVISLGVQPSHFFARSAHLFPLRFFHLRRCALGYSLASTTGRRPFSTGSRKEYKTSTSKVKDISLYNVTQMHMYIPPFPLCSSQSARSRLECSREISDRRNVCLYMGRFAPNNLASKVIR